MLCHVMLYYVVLCLLVPVLCCVALCYVVVSKHGPDSRHHKWGFCCAYARAATGTPKQFFIVFKYFGLLYSRPRVMLCSARLGDAVSRNTKEHVTQVLQGCHKSVTRMLQECCKSVTKVLQECYKSVTRVLQECNMGVTRVLRGRYQLPHHIEPPWSVDGHDLTATHRVVCLCYVLLCCAQSGE
jgi:hypothetical protein